MRKLSFSENLRHRFRQVPRLRHREEHSPAEGLLFLTIGAVVGVAAGALLTQKYGGFGAITGRIRDRFSGGIGEEEPGRYDGEAYDGGHDIELSPMEELEERVLDAYHNDPVLCERAIDIGALSEGIIELTGWVHSGDEAVHAVTVARGTPGVETVVNRIAVRNEEDEYESRARRFMDGDDALTEAQWDGGIVGMRRPTEEDMGEEELPSGGGEDVEAPRGD